MRNLGGWCFRHRRIVLGAWVAALVVVVALAQASGSHYNQSLNLPGTDSQEALNLLTRDFPAASGESDQLVVQSRGVDVRAPAVRADVSAMLARLSRVPGIQSVVSPYSRSGASQIARDGSVAFATVNWRQVSSQVTDADAERELRVAQSADGPRVRISLDGQAIENEESSGVGISVFIGVFAALIVLLIAFGGAPAPAVMTLVSTGVALVLGTSLVGLLSHVFAVPSVATQLSTLIGLGVGVDYGLFVISRYRSALKNGRSGEAAIGEALNTSGRTVLFAGATICIALLGQLALGVGFLDGMSVAAALVVALTMAAALTLLPAMLGFLGSRALARRERAAQTSASDVSPFWLGWARVVAGRRVLLGLGALAAVIVVALPIFALRLGNPDAGTDPVGSTTRQAYDALAGGFGPGFNGPLLLAARAGTPQDADAFAALLKRSSTVPDVSSVTPATASPNGETLIATVYPRTSPQGTATADLVQRLRREVIPAAETGTGLRVHVGGDTATNVDFANVLTRKLPVFIAIVVLLAFLLLMAVFQSVLIPLVAAVMNLLAIGATLGALNAVFNWGWGKSLLGLPGTGPISAFLPVLMFSVLFGLSMDYEVYLMSRIQEEWRALSRPEGGDDGTVAVGAESGAAAVGDPRERNHQAVVLGQAKAGRIIACAAGIMILVFGSFMLGANLTIKTFGFGLAFAVLIDAFLIRSIIVPSLMHLIGPRNWAMPARLRAVLPNLSVESGPEPWRPAAEAPPAPGHPDITGVGVRE